MAIQWVLVLLSVCAVLPAKAQSVNSCPDSFVKQLFGDACEKNPSPQSCFANGTCSGGLMCCSSGVCGGRNICIPGKCDPDVPSNCSRKCGAGFECGRNATCCYSGVCGSSTVCAVNNRTAHGPNQPPRVHIDHLCGIRPSFNHSLAHTAAPVDVAPVDVMVKAELTAEAKARVPVINVTCDAQGNFATDATLGDIFQSISTSFDSSVSSSVEKPLDDKCLPHVLAVYARPMEVNMFDHPMMMMRAFMEDNEGRNNGTWRDRNMRNATLKKAMCGLAKKGDGEFGLDDELLAVVSLDSSYNIQGDARSTKLKFVKDGCPLCGNVTLVVQVDPLGQLNDTNPCNNYLTFNVTFNCTKSCKNPKPSKVRQLYNLQPNQPPVLKFCNASRGGRSKAFQARMRGNHIQWVPITKNKLAFREMMRFPLAYEIMEMLHGETCPQCTNAKQDSCSASSTTSSLDNVDISDWEKIVTQAKAFISEMAQEHHPPPGSDQDQPPNQDQTDDDEQEAQKKLQEEIDSTMDCLFKKIKQAAAAGTCPFKKDMLPKLYQFQYDKCRTSRYNVRGQTQSIFDDENSEDMANHMDLGAIVDGLCPKRPDRQDGLRKFCKNNGPLSSADSASMKPPCQVDMMRSLLRENKAIRDVMFRYLNREAFKRMGPNLLSQRMKNALEMMGIPEEDLKQTTLWADIEKVGRACQPDPSAPSCAEPSRQLSFHDSENKVFCAVKNPDSDEMCAVPCAVKRCPKCAQQQERWHHEGCSWSDMLQAQRQNFSRMPVRCEMELLDTVSDITRNFQHIVTNMRPSMPMPMPGQNGWPGGSSGNGGYGESVRDWYDPSNMANGGSVMGSQTSEGSGFNVGDMLDALGRMIPNMPSLNFDDVMRGSVDNPNVQGVVNTVNDAAGGIGDIANNLPGMSDIGNSLPNMGGGGGFSFNVGRKKRDVHEKVSKFAKEKIKSIFA